jgi:hypothetical protein
VYFDAETLLARADHPLPEADRTAFLAAKAEARGPDSTLVDRIASRIKASSA